ncbi:PQQ-binding-like beta-propeller repeat protein [Corallococcus exiguus]|uniref:PQQ-binding-like beta-propeller repeat protein n=1 Tax=Corallococcus exiguus TaxID=83462 RepID=UPI001493F67B|nr:PQQ-binding-like beta-propeller repeat protein [Corallococcus exiguus]NPD28300.1 PQQ-binding-like beta-propeller repeat protein [Corallococcus exiguus]
MARPRASRCPHCNAPFTPQTAKTHYVCGYCGHAFDLDGPLPVQPGPRAPPPAQKNQQVVVMLAGVAVMVLMGVMGAVFFLAAGPDTHEPIRIPPPAAVRPVAPPVIPAPPPEPPKPAPERIQWVERGAPAFVDVNGDGTEDIVGHVSVHEPSSGFRHFIAAFDGRTFQKLWESAPSEGPDASRYTKVIAQNGRLVMSEQRTVNLLELETGKRLGRVPLTDSPRRLCIPPGDTTSVWVELVDHQHLLFDTLTATAKPAPRAPKGCATPPLSPQTCNMSRPAEHPTSCERSSYPPSDIRGFSTKYLFRTGGYTLALGTRWPGTQVPLVALYAPGNRKPLWHDTVSEKDPLLLRDTAPEVGEITQDAVYVVYELDKGGAQLIRRDLRTGAVAWDVALPETDFTSQLTALWVRGGRVYVPLWGRLRVLDAATGDRIGGIGEK